MKNIRDIREEKNLYFLLPEDVLVGGFLVCENVNAAVIVCLYYEESVYQYLSYVDNIPFSFHIYIVSSNKNLYEIIRTYICQNRNRKITLIKSKNRGRDISALLVASREIILNYEYICFTHDKKTKEWYPDNDFELWIENLWGNSLGSENYIKNVVNLLEKNKELGVLVPPEPIGSYINGWHINAWGNNYDLAQELVQSLDINCNLDVNKSPITLGTVFWAKSEAIKKIFEKKWNYTDFDEEPLKEDGTLSHAIERIIGYIAQDAGYDTGTIMTLSYATKLLRYTQKKFSPICQRCEKKYGFSDIEKFLIQKDKIYDFCNRNNQIFLYGAGNVGKKCLNMLREGGYKPMGYVVSDMKQNSMQMGDLPIKMLEDIDNIESVGLIITVGKKLQIEIENILIGKGIRNYIKYFE